MKICGFWANLCHKLNEENEFMNPTWTNTHPPGQASELSQCLPAPQEQQNCSFLLPPPEIERHSSESLAKDTRTRPTVRLHQETWENLHNYEEGNGLLTGLRPPCSVLFCAFSPGKRPGASLFSGLAHAPWIWRPSEWCTSPRGRRIRGRPPHPSATTLRWTRRGTCALFCPGNLPMKRSSSACYPGGVIRSFCDRRNGRVQLTEPMYWTMSSASPW